MSFKSGYYSGKSHGAPSFEYKTSLKTPKNRVDDDFDILFEKESPLGMERYEEEIKRQNI